MALFRKFFFRKPPDGLLEICERIYVFNCCFTTDAWEAEDYKLYVGCVIDQLREHHSDVSMLVFNFREGEAESQIANVLSEYDMTIMDYPRQYEGCPVLSMEMIHHFLRSSESWLSLGQQNVLLMHCERGGWPVLAFMLAALLIYRKQYTGEQRTLDMIYKQSPRELLHLLSSLNPLPSQIRYLQYVSRRNVASEWPPLDRAVTLDCVMIRKIPNFDGKGGCRPIFRIYGQDPLLVTDRTPKLLFSTSKKSKTVRHYKQAECEVVKIDINCHIQGDVVLECISLNDDMEGEAMIFRVMFNTAFIRSNILILNRDEIGILWDTKDQFSKDFRAEVLFSDMDAAASIVRTESSCFEEKEGLPEEAFAKVQEIFSSVDWIFPQSDAALHVLQHVSASNLSSEKLDISSNRGTETSALLHELSQGELREKQGHMEFKMNTKITLKLSGDLDLSHKKDERQAEKQKSALLSPLTLPPSSLTQPLLSPAIKYITCHPSSPLSTSESLAKSLTKQSDTFLNGGDQDSLVPVPTATKTPSSGTALDNVLSSPLSLPIGLANCPSTAPLPPSTPSLPSTFPLKDLGIGTGRPLPAFTPPPTHPSEGNIAIKTGPPTPPPPPPALPLTDNPAISIRIPPPPPPPPTPPLMDNPVIIRRPSPSPVSPPIPPPLPPPPTPPLKDSSVIRSRPNPPPPPPPPPNPPLSASTTDPPPPPPPPPRGPAISSSVPPPPPPPTSSSLQNPSRVFSAPPPPVPVLKGAVKMDSFSQQSLSNGYSKLSGSPSPAPPPRSLSNGKGRLSRTLSSRSHQMKKLKPLHWLKLNRASQGSLWAEAQKSGASKDLEIDMSELESLFSVSVSDSERGRSGRKSNSRASLGHKSEKVQLIEHRRAYNCEIMLSKVKIPLPDLLSSVLALEDSALDVDQVDNLVKFCPTKEEMELLKGFTGEKEKLGRCEQFFLELMQVPRVESKLRVFSFKIQFRSQVSELRNSLNVINSVAEEIRSSVKLKRVMQTILSLGNALNQGTARDFVVNNVSSCVMATQKLDKHLICHGSAVGFRLDSLLKLSETRARNNKMTLMHYLCKVLADKLPELLDFSKDLASLEPASKIQLKFLAEEMQAISKGLEKVVQELSLSESDDPVSEEFRKNLKEFLCFAEAEVRSLASLYSAVGKNVDALILYFGEDPSRCPFEQVVSTLLNFVKMFNHAHEENCKQLELEKKKAEKDAEIEKLKLHASKKDSEHLLRSRIKNL